MQRRKWDAKTKAMIVLEGLKGKPVAEICTEHQISQAQYYQWRDQFLAHAAKAFEVHEQTRTRSAPGAGECPAQDTRRGIDPGAKKKRRVAGMRRQPSLRVVQRDEGLLQRIQALKAEHPFWGYRRIWAYLRFVEQLPVNKKRILRLMREHHLLVPPTCG